MDGADRKNREHSEAREATWMGRCSKGGDLTPVAGRLLFYCPCFDRMPVRPEEVRVSSEFAEITKVVSEGAVFVAALHANSQSDTSG